MDVISQENLKQLIEPHFYDGLKNNNYKIQTIPARKLLTHTRLDIAFKLLYLEMLGHDVKFAKKAYKEHIRAFSLGKFIEPDNEKKDNLEKYIKEFKKTFEDIKINGFNPLKTLIPLSSNGSIANGAHRVTSAIYLNKDVSCVEIESPDHIYDYKFFYSRNVSVNMLDTAVTKFVEYATNIHIAFLWPIQKNCNMVVEEIVPNIVYKKNIQLNPNGAHNLLSQIYYSEKWLGTIENNFSGVNGKLVECFKTFDSFEVIAFQADSLDEVLKIKDKIREVFNAGKHSVHITDTKEEAIRTARVVFNENSLHFLNYAKPNKYISTHKKIDIFKEFVKKNCIDFNDVVLDSGIILSAYGLRESNDIDYFTIDNNKLKYHDAELEYHDAELEYHDVNKIEMIFNPKYHFYFNDMKLISFPQLYKMKTRRAEKKDKNDCKIMEALIENNKFKEFINKFKQNIYYSGIKVKYKVINILKIIGLYRVVRSFYRAVR
jgi:hypothetical protein